MIYTQSVSDLDKKLIDDILKIDSLVYPEHLQGTFDEVHGRFKVNREMFVLLYDQSQLIGYLCFFPIKEALYERIINEDMVFDSDIEGEMVEAYETGKTYKLYFLSVAIHPDYHGKGLSKLLVDGTCKFLEQKIKEGINFCTALITSVSPEGEALAKKLEFIEVKRLSCGYTVHEININELLRRKNI
ncbi:MAG: GNAT family N-acetyltransferase [Defluviitaleaceae bacterium]|nr:GNAT family N-acetyltransferase [Defluviitaleaceae bacterium]